MTFTLSHFHTKLYLLIRFIAQKFGHIKKKQYFCTAVPVIPLPDLMLVMNPGFYLWCLHDNLVTVLGWMNTDIQQWLESIDPFDNVCANIRKDMGWK